EGIKLRENGIQKDILILGICENIATAIEYNLIITVESTTQTNSIITKNLHPRIHLAVNTGMNRFGVNTIHELREILQKLSHERIEGIYTHLAYEEDNPKPIQLALDRFKKFTQLSQNYFPNITVHAGCSGVINFPIAHFDMIRIGKALYGGTNDTQTAITVTTQIVAIKKIRAGTTIGYNGTYTAKQNTIVGIVRGGYADGIPIQFSNTVSVYVGKQSCPIIGRICMDYFFVDVSKVVNPLTQKVTIIAPLKEQTLCEMAKKAKMVTCDLLLNLTSKGKISRT
ncbi:MAG: alanine racemase, partial [Clostridia bacterium]|nr:alanine racemase [Clostridia bacterium]